MTETLIEKQGQNSFVTRLLLVLLFQSVLYSMGALTIYAVVTLNWNLIIILFLIGFLQGFTPKSELFAYYAKRFVDPIQYYKSYTRIYDERINDDEKCLFTIHPHSIIPYCTFSMI